MERIVNLSTQSQLSEDAALRYLLTLNLFSSGLLCCLHVNNLWKHLSDVDCVTVTRPQRGAVLVDSAVVLMPGREVALWFLYFRDALADT